MDADDRVRAQSLVYGAVFSVVLTGIGGLLGYLWGLRGGWLVACAIAIGIAGGIAVAKFSMALADGAGKGFLAFVQPTGKTTPYEPEFSQGQALAAAGDITGAIQWYDMEMARLPGNVLVRMQSADVHARNQRPERAEALFLEARRLTKDRSEELYCTQRIIDLRLGALRAPARALPELRRLIERFPDSRESAGAQVALARLKQELPRDA